MKTYTKEEARDLFAAGTHQIHNDCYNIELLEYVVGRLVITNFYYYNIKGGCFNPIATYKTINLSQIIDEKAKIVDEKHKPKKMTFKYSDLEFLSDGKWTNYMAMCTDTQTILRIKPDYSKEIEALEKKAAEYGEKVIINFKSI